MIAAGIVYCYICLEPAFVAKRDLYGGEVARGMDVEHINGSEILDGSVIRCDDCGKPLDLFKLYQHNEVG